MSSFFNALFNNKMLFVFSVYVLSTCFFVQTLYAESLAKRGPAPLSVYDSDSNGSISQDEFNARREQQRKNRAAQGYSMKKPSMVPGFSELDTNQDGQLSQDELAREQQLQKLKRRGGMLQRKKYRRQGGVCGVLGSKLPRFEDFDKNKDRLLSVDEFNAGMYLHLQQNCNMKPAK